ncbi:MAG: hypothetical protein R6U17_07520 [Thermoplasmata archaeon]
MASEKYVPLDLGNVADIICCPGGIEIEGKGMKGDIGKTVSWRRDMLRMGMEGIIQYQEDVPVGFVEYMPTEQVPMPVVGPGTCTLMCFHWKGEDMKHLEMEHELLKRVLEKCRKDHSGMAALGWDHPVHFPVSMMEELGFITVERQDYLHLMWTPFENGADCPEFAEPCQPPAPTDRKIVIDQGYSNRCPYSIHYARKIRDIIDDVGRKNVEYALHRVDTREESMKVTIRPWNWDWLYINDKRIDVFATDERTIVELIKAPLSQ